MRRESVSFIAVSELLAVTVYWPLAPVARALETLAIDAPQVPLHYYLDKTYVMRNDALDRFGTRVE